MSNRWRITFICFLLGFGFAIAVLFAAYSALPDLTRAVPSPTPEPGLIHIQKHDILDAFMDNRRALVALGLLIAALSFLIGSMLGRRLDALHYEQQQSARRADEMARLAQFSENQLNQASESLSRLRAPLQELAASAETVRREILQLRSQLAGETGSAELRAMLNESLDEIGARLHQVLAATRQAGTTADTIHHSLSPLDQHVEQAEAAASRLSRLSGQVSRMLINAAIDATRGGSSVAALYSSDIKLAASELTSLASELAAQLALVKQGLEASRQPTATLLDSIERIEDNTTQSAAMVDEQWEYGTTQVRPELDAALTHLTDLAASLAARAQSLQEKTKSFASPVFTTR